MSKLTRIDIASSQPVTYGYRGSESTILHSRGRVAFEVKKVNHQKGLTNLM